MASYVAMTAPKAAAEDADAVLIRDGFSWLGFLLPVVWLAAHRLWLWAAALLVAGLAIARLSTVPGWGLPAFLLGVLLALWVGFEGNGLRISRRAGAGWVVRSVVEAPDLATAELIFFRDRRDVVRPAASAAAATASEPAPPPGWAPSGPGPAAHRAAAGPALGFIDYDGGR